MSGAHWAYVVDEDADLRADLTARLQHLNYQSRSFASAADFLDALAELAPGVVFLDLHMAGMSGVDLQAGLQDLAPAMQVIATAGFRQSEVTRVVRAMQLGAVDYLEKPFDDAALAASLALARQASGQQRPS